MTAMEPPAGGDPKTLKDAKVALFRAISPADPAHYVRGQYDGYLAIDGVAAGLDDRDVHRAAARDRELALVGRALLHPRRQAAPGHPDRGPARLQASTAARLRGVRPSARAEPARDQARSVDRRPDRPRCAPGRRGQRGADPVRRGVRREGGEGATPYEVLLHAAMVGRGDALHPPGRRRGDVADHAAAARRAAAGARLRAGLLGPGEAADELVAGTAAGTSPGSRHEQRVEGHRASSRRARRRRRRSRRSRTTRSSPTATRARSSRPTARSTGSASRASTRRASSAACSTAGPGRSGFGAVRDQPPDRARTTSPGRTSS